MTDLEIFRGDSKTYNFTFKDSAGVGIPITGYTVYFTVKENETDLDTNAKISKSVSDPHSDPDNGKTSISIGPTDTDLDVKNYFYDFQLKDDSGNITTFLKGNFKVKQDITISTD